MIAPFAWRDGPRTLHFGRGLRARLGEHLPPGYVLLASGSGLSAAPELAADAAQLIRVGPGNVDVLAAGILDDGLAAEHLVALGGGRVVDTAKAVAGVLGASVAAIPTTLSSAEMTVVHRLPAGYGDRARQVRPTLVLNDPALCASQPEAALAASSGNALAHAIEGRVSVLGSPVVTVLADEAQRRIGRAWADGGDALGDDARDDLAYASMLAGYAIDSAWYGLHHVLSQTLVRTAGVGHGPANAALLPHTIDALQRRDATTDPDGTLRATATLLAQTAQAGSLGALDVTEDALPACADAAAGRRELDNTPPRADREELLAIYRAAL